MQKKKEYAVFGSKRKRKQLFKWEGKERKERKRKLPKKKKNYSFFTLAFSVKME